MSDNVVKFRRPEKKPEPKPPRQRGPMPRWVPFAVLFAIAIVIFFVQGGAGGA
ncbi:hypothetical protein SAMN06295905_2418 [Devosia lucknowensis]|uniref:Uncharacterized protein n=1 Tax=Devosia lucknowensis TaxID=1096929 RepID=A0A1Y6FQJ9_9HYPH|nr:hypothetical protein [Devosia lucknowensis]SMQ75751.1 hypothetical protein SAMN06295905_2418 [Devosia lucknowensis]